MTYLYSDYKKLKDLEFKAYIIHKDFIGSQSKSLDEVITSSKAYVDYLSYLKIKSEKMRKIKTNNSISTTPPFITPLEKFKKRNKCDVINEISSISLSRKVKNLRLFAIGIFVCLLGSAWLLNKNISINKSKLGVVRLKY